MSEARPWEVLAEHERRSFATFERAERWARHVVAESGRNGFAIRATIRGPGEAATVRLDGIGRVWTDMGWPS